MKRFDLYLLESNLPDGTGIQLCQQLRTFDNRTPVLLFSEQKADWEQGFKAGVQAYLTKPADAHVLEAIIKCLIGQK